MNWYKQSTTIKTEDAIAHVVKSIDLILEGRLLVTKSRKLMPPWTHQKYEKVNLQVRNVCRDGDTYEIFVTMFVLKRPKSYTENIDIEREVPAWVKDETQWYDVSTFDSEEGNELLEFYVHIRGSKTGEKLDENIFRLPEFEYVADSREELGRSMNTPYEVSLYVKEAIENYDRRWDDDGGDDEDPLFDPEPDVPQLVGVPSELV